MGGWGLLVSVRVACSHRARFTSTYYSIIILVPFAETRTYCRTSEHFSEFFPEKWNCTSYKPCVTGLPAPIRTRFVHYSAAAVCDSTVCRSFTSIFNVRHDTTCEHNETAIRPFTVRRETDRTRYGSKIVQTRRPDDKKRYTVFDIVTRLIGPPLPPPRRTDAFMCPREILDPRPTDRF